MSSAVDGLSMRWRMATVKKEIAEQIAADNGFYPGDPQCYAVVKYKGPYGEGYSICYNDRDLLQVVHDVEVIEILWERGVKTRYDND